MGNCGNAQMQHKIYFPLAPWLDDKNGDERFGVMGDNCLLGRFGMRRGVASILTKCRYNRRLS